MISECKTTEIIRNSVRDLNSDYPSGVAEVMHAITKEVSEEILAMITGFKADRIRRERKKASRRRK